MTDISDPTWSETDAANTTLPAGWPTGMLPTAVEPAGRGMMGAIKRFWDRINGTVTTAGSAGAYTYTTLSNGYPSAYIHGEVYNGRANFTSVGNDTFNVAPMGGPFLGSKPIFKASTSGMAHIGAGDIQSGQMFLLAVDLALGGFQLLNPVLASGSGGTTGVTPGTYSLPTFTVGADGRLTAAANGAIPATGVGPGTYTNTTLTVGSDGRLTYAATGSSSIPPSGVTAGTYTNTNLTVGSDGRLTAAANGPSNSPFSQANLTSNGGVKFSNGLIINWGQVTTSSGGAATVNFSIPFTQPPFSVQLSPGAITPYSCSWAGASTGAMAIYTWGETGTGPVASAGLVSWLAIGV